MCAGCAGRILASTKCTHSRSDIPASIHIEAWKYYYWRRIELDVVKGLKMLARCGFMCSPATKRINGFNGGSKCPETVVIMVCRARKFKFDSRREARGGRFIERRVVILGTYERTARERVKRGVDNLSCLS